jgi:hypothetical protein
MRPSSQPVPCFRAIQFKGMRLVGMHCPIDQIRGIPPIPHTASSQPIPPLLHFRHRDQNSTPLHIGNHSHRVFEPKGDSRRGSLTHGARARSLGDFESIFSPLSKKLLCSPGLIGQEPSLPPPMILPPVAVAAATPRVS